MHYIIATNSEVLPLFRVYLGSIYSKKNTHKCIPQIRSVSRSEIPKWSTPAVSHRRQSSPPPDNINIVGDPVITIDDQRSAVNVKVDVSHTQKATKISIALLHFMSILL